MNALSLSCSAKFKVENVIFIIYVKLLNGNVTYYYIAHKVRIFFFNFHKSYRLEK